MTRFLRFKEEIDEARVKLNDLSWPLHIWDSLKDWDSMWLEPVIRDGDFLDIGCVNSMPLVIANAANVRGRKVGIDPCPPDSWKPQSDYEFFHGEAETLPFISESFDNVTCISVIEHNVDLDRFAYELCRVLRKDGRFVITFDCWPARKTIQECLTWAELVQLIISLTSFGCRLEPLDTTVGKRVIGGLYTFGCLRGVKL
jgi:SAM-dependent methyltransferase